MMIDSDDDGGSAHRTQTSPIFSLIITGKLLPIGNNDYSDPHDFKPLPTLSECKHQLVRTVETLHSSEMMDRLDLLYLCASSFIQPH